MSALSPNVVPVEDRDAKRLEVHKKTRLCKFFAVGACTRGSACAFAHGSAQLRDQPDFSKTRLCADFIELGKCSAGQRCKFAHSRTELRPGSAAKLGRPSARSATGHPDHQDEMKPEAAQVHVLQTLRAQHSRHEHAALKLMLQSAGVRVTSVSQVEVPVPIKTLDVTDDSSFSRQTTCEIETASASFSRDSSWASAAESANEKLVPSSEESPVQENLCNLEVRVKNTFIEVYEDAPETVTFRKTKSLPTFWHC
mmetsp:Transcript_17640/g.33172  ORF Transcript_17640/g.33172 Transcript_17640/m.33172 type:complete len:254 (+) Transcript_17640:74-835(+)